MLRLRALAIAVVVGMLTPFAPINGLNEFQVLAKPSEDQKTKADFLQRRGWVHLHSFKYQEAIDFFNTALKTYQKINDFSGQAKSLRGLGWAYHYTENFQKAIESYKISLTIERNAYTLNLLGSVYLQVGQFQKAIELNQEAIKISEDNEPLFFADIGLAYFSLGEYQKALKYSKQSLDISQARDKNTRNYTANDLGNILQALGNFEEALEYHQESLRYFRGRRNRYWEVNVLVDMGRVYL